MTLPNNAIIARLALKAYTNISLLNQGLRVSTKRISFLNFIPSPMLLNPTGGLVTKGLRKLSSELKEEFLFQEIQNLT